MLEFHQIQKHFPQTGFSLGAITCNLTPGLHVLIGPNGSGKSTLLRIAAGLLPPDNGNLICQEQTVYSQLPAYKSKLGYVPQVFAFYNHMTGMDFLLYLANLKGLFGQAAKKRAEYVIDLLALQPCCKKKIHTWSIGLRQRLSIAQALLNDPDILILDEPLAGVAFEEGQQIIDLFQQLAKKKIIFMSSHLLNDLPITRLLVLINGQLKFNGLPSVFIDQISLPPAADIACTTITSPVYSPLAADQDDKIRLIHPASWSSLSTIDQIQPTLEEAYLLWLQQNRGEKKYDHPL